MAKCQTVSVGKEMLAPHPLGTENPQHFKVVCLNGNYPKQFS